MAGVAAEVNVVGGWPRGVLVSGGRDSVLVLRSCSLHCNAITSDEVCGLLFIGCRMW